VGVIDVRNEVGCEDWPWPPDCADVGDDWKVRVVSGDVVASSWPFPFIKGLWFDIEEAAVPLVTAGSVVAGSVAVGPGSVAVGPIVAASVVARSVDVGAIVAESVVTGTAAAGVI